MWLKLQTEVFKGEPSPKSQDQLAVLPITGLIVVFVNFAESNKQVLLNVNADCGASNVFTEALAVSEQPSTLVVNNSTVKVPAI